MLNRSKEFLYPRRGFQKKFLINSPTDFQFDRTHNILLLNILTNDEFYIYKYSKYPDVRFPNALNFTIREGGRESKQGRRGERG